MPQDAAPDRVTVTFPDGTVTLMPSRAPVGNSGPIRGETMLALPLQGASLTTIAEHLASLLGRQIQSAPATLNAGESAERPAIAVLGLTPAEAERIGSISNLEAVFFWDGRRASILNCAPAT